MIELTVEQVQELERIAAERGWDAYASARLREDGNGYKIPPNPYRKPPQTTLEKWLGKFVMEGRDDVNALVALVRAGAKMRAEFQSHGCVRGLDDAFGGWDRALAEAGVRA